MEQNKKEINVQTLANSIRTAGKVQRVVEFDCPYIKGFKVKIAHANKFIMNQVIDHARETSTEFKRGRQEETERLNEDRLREGYAEWIVTGWNGLTGEQLQKLIPGAKIEGATSTQEIPYSQEIVIALFEVSLEFETWVVGIATNIKNYTKTAETKKRQNTNLS